MTKTIGFLQFGAAADIGYATPILRHVRKLYPDAHITWCVRDKFINVIETNPHLDAIKTYTLPEGHSSRQEAEHVMWSRMKEEAVHDFDLVIKPQQWPDHDFWRSNKDLISLMAENAGFDPDDIKDRSVVLELTNEDVQNVTKFYLDHLDGIGQFITINHISYAAQPVWPLDNYTRLISLLDDSGIISVVTGAPNEEIPQNCIDARGMPYREWAGLIGMSDLHLLLDSGAKTLAASTDTPMIVLHSNDFPLAKTGCVAMGIRTNNILELCPAPSVESLAGLIVESMR